MNFLQFLTKEKHFKLTDGIYIFVCMGAAIFVKERSNQMICYNLQVFPACKLLKEYIF